MIQLRNRPVWGFGCRTGNGQISNINIFSGDSGRLGMADIRRTYGEYTADIWRIYSGHTANIRRTYGGHTANIRQTYGGHASKTAAYIRRTYGELIMYALLIGK